MTWHIRISIEFYQFQVAFYMEIEQKLIKDVILEISFKFKIDICFFIILNFDFYGFNCNFRYMHEPLSMECNSRINAD